MADMYIAITTATTKKPALAVVEREWSAANPTRATTECASHATASVKSVPPRAATTVLALPAAAQVW